MHRAHADLADAVCACVPLECRALTGKPHRGRVRLCQPERASEEKHGSRHSHQTPQQQLPEAQGMSGNSAGLGQTGRLSQHLGGHLAQAIAGSSCQALPAEAVPLAEWKTIPCLRALLCCRS